MLNSAKVGGRVATSGLGFLSESGDVSFRKHGVIRVSGVRENPVSILEPLIEESNFWNEEKMARFRWVRLLSDHFRLLPFNWTGFEPRNYLRHRKGRTSRNRDRTPDYGSILSLSILVQSRLSQDNSLVNFNTAMMSTFVYSQFI